MSVIKSIIGALIFIGSLFMLSVSALAILFGSLFTIILPSFSGILVYPVILLIAGIIGTILGARLFFQNAEAIGNLLIGLFGVVLFLFGIIVFFSGVVEAFSGIGIIVGLFSFFIDILILSLAISLIELGFDVDVIPKSSGLIGSLGKLSDTTKNTVKLIGGVD